MSATLTDAGPPASEPPSEPSGASDTPTATTRRPLWWSGPRWYQFGLGGVALAALAVRLYNVLVVRPTCREDIIAVIEQQGSKDFTPTGGQNACFGIWGDSAYYYIQGRQIARGNWFIDSYSWFASGGERFKPSSGNPPMFSMFLGLIAKLGLTSGTSMRVATAVLGVVGVVLIVTLTRKLAGPRAAIVAGVLAAVNPMLWINDGMLLSETLYVPVILLALHAAYRFWEKPGYGSAALFGLMMGLAALTRGEAIILLGVMVLPLLWGMREKGFGTLAKYAGITYLVGAACIAPWIAYNMSRFREPVLMTSSTGAVLSSANCDITYYTESIGYYGNCFDEYVAKGLLIGKIPGCTQEVVDKAKFDPTGAEAAKCWPNDPNLDESERDKFGRDIAVEYMKTHKSRLPIVMAARIGRMWDVYMPDLGRSDEPFGQNVRFNWQVEGRGQTASRVGLLMFYGLWPFALMGGIWLVRRRVPISPLLSMTIVITVTSAFTFGITRYRVPVDIMMVVMAAAGIEWILQWLWPRADVGSLLRLRPRRGGHPERDPEDPVRPVTDGDPIGAPHDPAAALAAIAAPAPPATPPPSPREPQEPR
jgi:4-amino-4-deoxy-L-arabinose transferase-like glycosyltransferase